MDFKGQGARFSNVPGRVQAGLKTGVENDIFWSETVGSRLGEPGGTPQPRITRPTTLCGFLGNLGRFCDTRISNYYIKETQGFLRGMKANDKQKSWCRKCSLLQRAFPKLEKHTQQRKRPFRIGYLVKALRFLSILVSLLLLFFFTDICVRACISQRSTHYSQLLRQLVAFLYFTWRCADLIGLFSKTDWSAPIQTSYFTGPYNLHYQLFSGIGALLCHHPYCFPSQSQTFFEIGGGRPSKTMNDSHVG